MLPGNRLNQMVHFFLSFHWAAMVLRLSLIYIAEQERISCKFFRSGFECWKQDNMNFEDSMAAANCSYFFCFFIFLLYLRFELIHSPYIYVHNQLSEKRKVKKYNRLIIRGILTYEHTTICVHAAPARWTHSGCISIIGVGWIHMFIFGYGSCKKTSPIKLTQSLIC